MDQLRATAGMITLARESRGLTQTALSREIGVSQGLLSKVENEQIEASDELLNKLAKRLDYPLAFFTGASLRIQSLPVTFFRRRKTLGKRIVRQVSAKVNVVRFHAHRLLKSIDIPEDVVPRWDLEEGGAPESVALDLRRHWNVPSGPIVNLVGHLERKGILVIPCDFGTRKIDGLSLFAVDDDLPPMLFFRQDLSGDRLRWTLAHELAHVVLHLHLDLPGLDTESEADRFAAELLMPTEEIRGHLGRLTIPKLASLKRHWGVSMQALIMKASATGRITESQKRYLFIKLSQLGYRTQEPIEVAKEEPQLLSEMIETHLRELGYSEAQLCAALSIREDDFREYYYPKSEVGLRLVT